jgi:hypothetical protein
VGLGHNPRRRYERDGSGGDASSSAKEKKVDLKLEVVVIPVPDVGRTKEFCSKLGWRLAADFPFDNGIRIVQFEVVASNILGEPREANHDAVPRVLFTDPQAAALGATSDRFNGTARLLQLPKTETYTRAYAESKGFLILLSDGQRLTGACALGPEAGVASTGDVGGSRPRADRGAARHDPAVSDLLRDLRWGAQGAAGGDRDGAHPVSFGAR